MPAAEGPRGKPTESILTQLSYPNGLILGEIGYMPHSRQFFRLVSRRYEMASMILTSKKPITDWGDVFGDGRRHLILARE